MQDAYIKSFNGNFRDEFVNGHGLARLACVGVVIASYSYDYSEGRPKSALNYFFAAKFAAEHRAAADILAALR